MYPVFLYFKLIPFLLTKMGQGFRPLAAPVNLCWTFHYNILYTFWIELFFLFFSVFLLYLGFLFLSLPYLGFNLFSVSFDLLLSFLFNPNFSCSFFSFLSSSLTVSLSEWSFNFQPLAGYDFRIWIWLLDKVIWDSYTLSR